jgi:hypothetical protein
VDYYSYSHFCVIVLSKDAYLWLLIFVQIEVEAKSTEPVHVDIRLEALMPRVRFLSNVRRVSMCCLHQAVALIIELR